MPSRALKRLRAAQAAAWRRRDRHALEHGCAALACPIQGELFDDSYRLLLQVQALRRVPRATNRSAFHRTGG